uniref:ANK_REP_REGION domain-containing protein n=1 Tax=Macrostomum lignano TaxID=282301 RepID=A0A1I8IKM2_9PLAT
VKKTTHGAAGRILDMQDSEGNSSVHFAAKNDKFLLEQSAPIHLAATLGHRESVAKLIHLGALPNLSDKNGRTPLHCCIIARQLEICDTLLLAGAQSRAADEDFMTPLHWACRRGLTQAARRLLRVDPGCLSLVDIHMRTGLHWAVLACAVDLVELLLAQAGDSDESANASDFHDKYPVHYAVEMNDCA